MKRIITTLLVALLAALSPLSLAKEEVLTLNWIDLIPLAERNNVYENALSSLEHASTMPASQLKVGTVRKELNGSKVKIPGFVIPLEGDENTITEFLLVPFFGACIHVPPPPPNQIVYVRIPNGAPVQELWDVVYVIGTLSTKPEVSELAEAGYTIENATIEEYTEG
ncbi:DUF3299 domain-containing protein [Vibrio sp.]|uniref:DUF3299 domain-containing protein n=1 Tax=Vibrio sp. TaxID=678 RepID=UPI003D104956